MSEKAILVALLAENAESCDPPLTDEEVERIASSVARYDPSGPGPILVTLADVNPMPISWLWPGRIPLGKLSLIAGDPGVGKSLLVSDMAARISIGGPWPDGGNAPKGKVILLTAEDGLADTVRPRLDAMGGDPSSVVILTGVLRNGADEMFDLTEDLPHLETAIVQTGAHFVAIDPLSAYLGKTDSYKDPDVRKVLTPLGALAEQRNVAIVGIMHLSKDAQRKALYRTQGSVAFVAAGRATYVVTADHYESERKLLLPLKINIAASPPGLAFAISDDTGDTARVVWETNPVEVDAEAALAGPSPTKARTARNDAMMLLREVLADGPVPAMELEYQAEQSGIKKRTLDRAKKALGVQSRKKEGKDGEWEWVLPDNVATEGTPGEVATLATFDQDRSTNTEMANALDKDAKNANSQGEANIGGWAYPVRRTPSGVRLRIAKKPRWWEMARRGGVRRHRDRKKGTR